MRRTDDEPIDLDELAADGDAVDLDRLAAMPTVTGPADPRRGMAPKRDRSFMEAAVDEAANVAAGASAAATGLAGGLLRGPLTVAAQAGSQTAQDTSDAIGEASGWLADLIDSGGGEPAPEGYSPGPAIDRSGKSFKVGSSAVQGVVGVGSYFVPGGRALYLGAVTAQSYADTDLRIRKAAEGINSFRAANGQPPIEPTVLSRMVTSATNAAIETGIEMLSGAAQNRLGQTAFGNVVRERFTSSMMRRMTLGVAGESSIEGAEEFVTTWGQTAADILFSPELRTQAWNAAVKSLAAEGKDLPTDEEVIGRIMMMTLAESGDALAYGAIGGAAGAGFQLAAHAVTNARQEAQVAKRAAGRIRGVGVEGTDREEEAAARPAAEAPPRRSPEEIRYGVDRVRRASGPAIYNVGRGDQVPDDVDADGLDVVHDGDRNAYVVDPSKVDPATVAEHIRPLRAAEGVAYVVQSDKDGTPYAVRTIPNVSTTTGRQAVRDAILAAEASGGSGVAVPLAEAEAARQKIVAGWSGDNGVSEDEATHYAEVRDGEKVVRSVPVSQTATTQEQIQRIEAEARDRGMGFSIRDAEEVRAERAAASEQEAAAPPDVDVSGSAVDEVLASAARYSARLDGNDPGSAEAWTRVQEEDWTDGMEDVASHYKARGYSVVFYDSGKSTSDKAFTDAATPGVIYISRRLAGDTGLLENAVNASVHEDTHLDPRFRRQVLKTAGTRDLLRDADRWMPSYADAELIPSREDGESTAEWIDRVLDPSRTDARKFPNAASIVTQEAAAYAAERAARMAGARSVVSPGSYGTVVRMLDRARRAAVRFGARGRLARTVLDRLVSGLDPDLAPRAPKPPAAGGPRFARSPTPLQRRAANEHIRRVFTKDYGESSPDGMIDGTTGFLLADGTPVRAGTYGRDEDHSFAIPTAAKMRRLGFDPEAIAAVAGGTRTPALRELLRVSGAVRVHVGGSVAAFESHGPLTRAQRRQILDLIESGGHGDATLVFDIAGQHTELPPRTSGWEVESVLDPSETMFSRHIPEVVGGRAWLPNLRSALATAMKTAPQSGTYAQLRAHLLRSGVRPAEIAFGGVPEMATDDGPELESSYDRDEVAARIQSPRIKVAVVPPFMHRGGDSWDDSQSPYSATRAVSLPGYEVLSVRLPDYKAPPNPFGLGDGTAIEMRVSEPGSRHGSVLFAETMQSSWSTGIRHGVAVAGKGRDGPAPFVQDERGAASNRWADLGLKVLIDLATRMGKTAVEIASPSVVRIAESMPEKNAVGLYGKAGVIHRSAIRLMRSLGAAPDAVTYIGDPGRTGVSVRIEPAIASAVRDGAMTMFSREAPQSRVLKIGMDVPAMLKQLGANLYGTERDRARVVIRELVQNSVDASRASGNGVTTTVNDIVREPERLQVVRVSDAGGGMAPEVVDSALVTVGQSLKGETASGGFGIAKLAIFAAGAPQAMVPDMPTVKIETVAIVDGAKVGTRVSGWGDTFLQGLHAEPIPESDLPSLFTEQQLAVGGTVATVVLPPGSGDATRHAKAIWALSRGLRLGVDGEAEPPPDQRTVFERIRVDDDTELEVLTATETVMGQYPALLNNGLFQGTSAGYVGTADDVPLPLISINVISRAQTSAGNYPWTQSRDYLRGDAAVAMDLAIQRIIAQSRAGFTAGRLEWWRSGHPFPGGSSGGILGVVLPVREPLPGDVAEAEALARTIASSPEIREMLDISRELLTALASWDDGAVVGGSMEADSARRAIASGYVPLGGVTIASRRMAGRSRTLGFLARIPTEVADELPAYGPFRIFLDPINIIRAMAARPGAIASGTEGTARLIASEVVATAIHEYVHIGEFSHDADYASSLTSALPFAATDAYRQAVERMTATIIAVAPQAAEWAAAAERIYVNADRRDIASALASRTDPGSGDGRTGTISAPAVAPGGDADAGGVVAPEPGEGQAPPPVAFSREPRDLTGIPDAFKRTAITDSLIGGPRLVLHGTVTRWTGFRSPRSRHETAFGNAIYFTDSLADAVINYSADGPDRRSSVDLLAERIRARIGVAYEEAAARARRTLIHHGGAIIEAVLLSHKPLRLHSDHLDHREFGRFIGSLRRDLKRLSPKGVEPDLQRLHDMREGGESGAHGVREAALGIDDIAYAESARGQLVGHDLVSKAFRAAGFDAIVASPSALFPGMTQPRETQHYMVWSPKQVHVVSGPTPIGNYDPPSQIRFSREVDPSRFRLVQGYLPSAERARVPQGPMALRSVLDEALSTAQPRGTIAQLRAHLARAGVRAAELFHSGLSAYMDARAPGDKYAIADVVAARRPIPLPSVRLVPHNPQAIAAEVPLPRDETNTTPVRYDVDHKYYVTETVEEEEEEEYDADVETNVEHSRAAVARLNDDGSLGDHSELSIPDADEIVEAIRKHGTVASREPGLYGEVDVDATPRDADGLGPPVAVVVRSIATLEALDHNDDYVEVDTSYQTTVFVVRLDRDGNPLVDESFDTDRIATDFRVATGRPSLNQDVHTLAELDLDVVPDGTTLDEFIEMLLEHASDRLREDSPATTTLTRTVTVENEQEVDLDPDDYRWSHSSIDSSDFPRDLYALPGFALNGRAEFDTAISVTGAHDFDEQYGRIIFTTSVERDGDVVLYRLARVTSTIPHLDETGALEPEVAAFAHFYPAGIGDPEDYASYLDDALENLVEGKVYLFDGPTRGGVRELMGRTTSSVTMALPAADMDASRLFYNYRGRASVVSGYDIMTIEIGPQLPSGRLAPAEPHRLGRGVLAHVRFSLPKDVLLVEEIQSAWSTSISSRGAEVVGQTERRPSPTMEERVGASRIVFSLPTRAARVVGTFRKSMIVARALQAALDNSSDTREALAAEAEALGDRLADELRDLFGFSLTEHRTSLDLAVRSTDEVDGSGDGDVSWMRAVPLVTPQVVEADLVLTYHDGTTQRRPIVEMLRGAESDGSEEERVVRELADLALTAASEGMSRLPAPGQMMDWTVGRTPGEVVAPWVSGPGGDGGRPRESQDFLRLAWIAILGAAVNSGRSTVVVVDPHIPASASSMPAGKAAGVYGPGGTVERAARDTLRKLGARIRRGPFSVDPVTGLKPPLQLADALIVDIPEELAARVRESQPWPMFSRSFSEMRARASRLAESDRQSALGPAAPIDFTNGPESGEVEVARIGRRVSLAADAMSDVPRGLRPGVLAALAGAEPIPDHLRESAGGDLRVFMRAAGALVPLAFKLSADGASVESVKTPAGEPKRMPQAAGKIATGGISVGGASGASSATPTDGTSVASVGSSWTPPPWASNWDKHIAAVDAVKRLKGGNALAAMHTAILTRLRQLGAVPVRMYLALPSGKSEGKGSQNDGSMYLDVWSSPMMRIRSASHVQRSDRRPDGADAGVELVDLGTSDARVHGSKLLEKLLRRFGDKAPPPSFSRETTKSRIRAATGQTDTSGPTTKRVALRESLRGQERAAAAAAAEEARKSASAMRAAARAAADASRRQRQQLIADAREAVRAAVAKARLKASVRSEAADEARAQIIAAAERLPVRLRGKLLRLVGNGTTPAAVAEAGERVDELLARDALRSAVVRVRSWRKLVRRRSRKIDGEHRARVEAAMAAASLVAFGSSDRKANRAVRHADPSDAAAAAAAITEHLDNAVAALADGLIEAKATRLLNRMTAREAAGRMAATLAARRKPIPAKRGRIMASRPSSAVSDYLAQHLDLMTTGYIMEGPGRGVLLQMVRRLRRAESRMLARRYEIASLAEAAAAKAGYRTLAHAHAELGGSLGRASQGLVDVVMEGRTIRIARGEAMSLAAMDPETRSRLSSGAVDPVTGSLLYDGSPVQMREGSELREVYVTRPEVEAIERQLSPREMDFVRALKGIIEKEVAPAMFAAHRSIHGYEPVRVPDYWPSSRNRNRVQEAPLAGTTQQVVTRFFDNAGMLQNRVGGRLPYVVGDVVSTFLSHVEDALRVAYFARPLRVFDAVLRSGDLQHEVAVRFGDGMNERLRSLLYNAVGVDPRNRYPITGVILAAQGNVISAKLALSVFTWLRQFGGIGKMLDRYSASELLAALPASVLRNMRTSDRDDLWRGSGFLRARHAASAAARFTLNRDDTIQVFDAAGARLAASAAVASAASGEWGDATANVARVFRGIQVLNVIDRFIAMVAYSVELRRLSRRGVRGAKAKALAAQRAEDAVRETQNTSSPIDDSLFQAQNKEYASLLAPMTSDVIKSFQMLRRAAVHGVGSRRMRKTITAIAANVAWSAAIIEAVVRPAIGELAASLAGGDDPERRRRRWWDAAVAAAIKAAKEVVPLYGVGFAVDTASALLGTSHASSGDTIVTQAIGGVRRTIEWAKDSKQGRRAPEDEIRSTLRGIAAVAEVGELVFAMPFGAPYRQLAVPFIQGLYDHTPEARARFWQDEVARGLRLEREALDRGEQPDEGDQEELRVAEEMARMYGIAEPSPEDDIEARIARRARRMERALLRSERDAKP